MTGPGIAGDLNGLFDFDRTGEGHGHGQRHPPNAAPFILDPATGRPVTR